MRAHHLAAVAHELPPSTESTSRRVIPSAAAARPRPRSTAASIEHRDRHRLATGAACDSIWPRSSRSSMIAPEPVGLGGDPLGELADDRRRRRPPAIVSASTASAPTGVLSSWLTLATKSRRTRLDPARLGDVADEHDRTEDRAVGDERAGGQEEAPRAAVRRAAARASHSSPLRARSSSSSICSAGERVGCAGRRWNRSAARCAARPRPSASTTTTASPTASSASASRRRRGPRRCRRRRSASSPSRAAGRPTCAGSSEPAGDVTLGALVRRAGEDRLRAVELDEPAGTRLRVVGDVGREERGACPRRAPPAACCG